MADWKDWMRQFNTFLIAVLGQAVLICITSIAQPIAFSMLDVNPSLILLISIALAIGIGMLLFIFSKFVVKYRKNPSTARMNTLLAIVAFIIATTAYFMAETFTFPEQILDRFFSDTANIFVIVGAFLFLILGVSFFMAPVNERSFKLLVFVLNIALITIYAGLMIFKIALVVGVDPKAISMLGKTLLYTIFGFGGVCLVLMVLIAFKALINSRKIDDSVYKKGLFSLGLSYLFLTVAIVVLITSNLVQMNVVLKQSLIVGVIILLSVAFYFVYEGFVKPTGAVKTNEAKEP